MFELRTKKVIPQYVTSFSYITINYYRFLALHPPTAVMYYYLGIF